MRKSLAKILFVLPMLILCFAASKPALSAANIVQDGLAVTLVADKSSYEAGDTIQITATVTNTNSFAVNNVKLEITLPDGVKFSSGEKTLTVANLAAGQTQTLSLVATAERSADKPGNPPRTGDNTWIWIFTAAASAGIIAVLIVLKKRALSKNLCLILCAALVLSAVTPAVAVSAATQTKNISVSETIMVGGISRTILLEVTYDLDIMPEPPTTHTFVAPDAQTTNGVTATVTFDKTSPLAAGETVTATVTLSGTAAVAGTFTINLASVTAGLAPTAETKVATEGAELTDTYDFIFNMPDQDVDDFVITFSFVAAPPSVFTGEATNITAKSATIINNSYSNMVGTVTRVVVHLSKSSSFSSTTIVHGAVGLPFSVNLSNLDSNTTYYYRAAVDSDLEGIVYGETREFRTTAPDPEVSTGTAIDITTDSAYIMGSLHSNIPGAIESVAIEYSTSESFSDSHIEYGTIQSFIYMSLSGLNPGTTYYYRAVVSSTSGTYKGETKSFTTLSASPLFIPDTPPISHRTVCKL